MKKICILILVKVLCAGAFADHLPLGQLGRPFHETNLDLAWTAPTHELPRALRVYRVLPSKFSPAVVSNLMALGSFTAKDKKEPFPHVTSYTTADEKRLLWINPDRGYIEYRDSDADDMNIAEGVPDEKQTYDLAIQYLPKLGIDRSQLAVKPNSSELRTYVTYKEALLYKGLGMPAYATNIPMRGVFFIRSLDGVDFFGKGVRGGCTIEIGHHAKMSQIIVGWRNLKRDKLYQVAKPETVVKWIRDGKAFLQRAPDSHVNWTLARKMNIVKATPFYFGEPYIDRQDWVYPFMTLEASVDAGERHEVVTLYCPMLEKAPGKPLE